jgi:hypothetical protein
VSEHGPQQRSYDLAAELRLRPERPPVTRLSRRALMTLVVVATTAKTARNVSRTTETGFEPRSAVKTKPNAIEAYAAVSRLRNVSCDRAHIWTQMASPPRSGELAAGDFEFGAGLQEIGPSASAVGLRWPWPRKRSAAGQLSCYSMNPAHFLMERLKAVSCDISKTS